MLNVQTIINKHTLFLQEDYAYQVM